jgi:uncharacterized membrane protein (DUF2068 family)
VVSLLTVTSSALLFALKNHQILEKLAESYWLESPVKFLEFLLLDKVRIVKPKTLLFSGLAAGPDAVLTAVEPVGLWHEQGWATILVLLRVGISIPPEIYELVQGVTVLKLVFIANLAVLWYLLHPLLKHGKGAYNFGNSEDTHLT